jgi:DNA-binding response OmpR family regulator
MKVLIVEDDRLVGDALARTLRAAGYEPHRCTSAEEAIAVVTTARFALAIVDIGLPGESGLDFTHRMREAGHRWPVLIVTARDSADDRSAALAAGANGYLSKPFGVAELIDCCRKLAPTQSGEQPARVRSIGNLKLDISREVVLAPNLARDLSRSEWRLLEQLSGTPGKIVPQRDLLRWVQSAEQLEASIEALRILLADAVTIRRVRGVGYQLAPAGDAIAAPNRIG